MPTTNLINDEINKQKKACQYTSVSNNFLMIQSNSLHHLTQH